MLTKNKFITVMVLPLCISFVSCTIEKNNPINILFTNDVHCGFNTDTENKMMGVAGIAGYREHLINEYGKKNVTLVDAGDFIQGEPIGMFSNGEYPVQIMNALEYDVATIGNHEFDYTVNELIRDGGLLSKNETPYVSCNFKDINNKNILDSYKIFKYKDVKIAFIGVISPDVFSTCAKPESFKNDQGECLYTFLEDSTGDRLANEVQRTIDEAKSHADYVIGLTHLGTDDYIYSSINLISKTSGFDFVIDAHSHSVVENLSIKDKNQNFVPLMSTGTKLENLGYLKIDTNGTKNKKDDIFTIDLLDYDHVSPYLNSPSATSIKEVVSHLGEDVNKLIKEQIGTSEINLPIYDENNVRMVRNRSTRLANLVTDSYLDVVDADIAFVNGGGVRDSINKGPITKETIYKVQPFTNGLTVIEATGQQIIDALEFGARMLEKEVSFMDTSYGLSAKGENGGLLHTSGLKYTVDVDIETTVKTDDKSNFSSVEGARRVKDVLVFNKNTKSYDPIDLTKTYKLVGSNYILKIGGDGYTMFGECPTLLENFTTDSQAFIDYVSITLKGTITDTNNSSGETRLNIIGR